MRSLFQDCFCNAAVVFATGLLFRGLVCREGEARVCQGRDKALVSATRPLFQELMGQGKRPSLAAEADRMAACTYIGRPSRWRMFDTDHLADA